MPLNWNEYQPVQYTDYFAGMNPTIQRGIGKEMREVGEETGRGESGYNSLREGAQIAGLASAMDPTGGFAQWRDIVYGDPRMNKTWAQSMGALGNMAGATNRFNQQAQGFLQNVLPNMRKRAFGPRAGMGAARAMRKEGRVAQRQAQKGIAQQAMMGAGSGGMTAADRRQAIMQSGDVGANMAGQMAAQAAQARLQQRQANQQQFLQAKQAQLQARQAGVGAMGNLAQARMNQFIQAQNTLGGAANLAQNQYGQQQTALQNYLG